MKEHELFLDQETSVLVCYDVEESESTSQPVVTDHASGTPKLRAMRTICLDECAIPE